MLAETLIEPIYTVDTVPLDEIGDQPWELWDGRLYIMTFPNSHHNYLARRIIRLFEDFCESRPGLYPSPMGDGFVIAQRPQTKLSPDAALYRVSPDRRTARAYFSPELAVEVLSPSNSMVEMKEKRARYFAAGTEQFWLVFQHVPRIEVHFPGGRYVRFEGGVLQGEGIVEGLKIDLDMLYAGSIFPPEGLG